MTKPPSPVSSTDRVLLIETFVRIVEAGSLSAAAVQLGGTQPTVSRRLQLLERMLGVRLLQRSTHAIRLTEDGQRCYQSAKNLIAGWDSLESEVRGGGEEPAGMLRVVAPHAFGQHQFVEPLARYLRQYPQMRVEWLLHDRMPDFIAENIDCALRVGPITDPSVVALKLGEVPRIVVAAPGVLQSIESSDDPRQLAALPWVALRTFYRDEVVLTNLDTGEVARFGITPRLSTDGLHALRRAAVLGLGAGLGSAWAMSEDIAQGRLVHVAPRWHAEPLPVYLVYPPSRYQPVRLRRFIDVMREYLPAELRMAQGPAD
ncbi:LysR family transcriptional regulator [Achromobacter insolitus]|uniref:LysR family transcriptional regulator n=1 Tax=Achromobacter insolitus TaxID=217204 RepID=UPI000972D0FF|nr:LysR family transcriptional regulator [Achromobacter insolitus]APX75866.1 LysR family transcriptional regulator [Achromobacter insolitus]AXA71450.1 LysR family transcriptional regulator [Achromobacter insolitus]MDH3063151.1 LysR family transcriptional regulator [Achromobacter insolitus]OWT56507.1 LysR family transcriptional regulator [Achromobacter insolitus]CAB3741348.1 HTH-type transcriptional regulator DmlR [Achromobacter insolitus]